MTVGEVPPPSILVIIIIRVHGVPHGAACSSIKVDYDQRYSLILHASSIISLAILLSKITSYMTNNMSSNNMSRATMYFPPSISQEPRGSMRIPHERHRRPSRTREYADQMVNLFSSPRSLPSASNTTDMQMDSHTGQALSQSLDTPKDGSQGWSLWHKARKNEEDRMSNSSAAFDQTETGGSVFGIANDTAGKSDQKARPSIIPTAHEIDSNLVDSLFSDY